jgi:hypothetical protein
MSTAPPAGAPGGPSGSLLAALTGLVDDAAIFPPGNAKVPDALRDHARHRGEWYAGLVGGFVCPDTRLAELQAALDEVGGDVELPLDVNLTISGGAGAIEPALTWVGRDDRLRLVAVEVTLRDESDLAHNAARMTTVLGGCLPDGVTAYVEVPRLDGSDVPASWGAALDELGAAGVRGKFRTGGLDHSAFPEPAELVTVVDAFLDRELAFKCTAGLHHAVGHTDEETGFEHHGFLNVLLATRALLDGRSRDDVRALLEERDAGAVAAQVQGLGAEGMTSTRRWFTSFGSCSVTDPVRDLVDLGLLTRPEGDTV